MKRATLLAGMFSAVFVLVHSASALTPLALLPAPRVVNDSGTPGGSFAVSHLFDGDPKTEYASRDKGTNTVVRMEFEKPTTIAAVRHVNRNDPATVALSEFQFDNGSTVTVAHRTERAGETLFILPEPVTATRVTWRITKLGNNGLFSVGGAELAFFSSAPADAAPVRDEITAKVLPFVDRQGKQTLEIQIVHPYVETVQGELHVSGLPARTVSLSTGKNNFSSEIPQVKKEAQITLQLKSGGVTAAQAFCKQKPVRQMTVYVLPHSHTDIGYTEIQSAIEAKQVKNLVDGMAAAARTADYPAGARFVWNVEVGWAADLFLQRMDEKTRREFFTAVKNGQVALNGMYLNELTGLCRPEELIQLFRFSTRMAEQTGVPIDSAMISDVPGFTWGTVSAMAQAGIKYFSVAPNYFDRIGTILKEWENRPFYWQGPDGKTKVLVWIPFWGYAMSHIYHEMSPKLVTDFYEGLEKRAYPFDIAYVRWAGHGDNAVPDPAICDFIRDWNEKYASPRFVISGTSEAFKAFEDRYGSQLPVVRGDWTPYWEDGAGSSALETANNRLSSDRLSQAATAFLLREPASYQPQKFEDAWRNVLLYSEHTWGAWCSVSGPDRKETKEQWEIKKGYADKAQEQSHALLNQALSPKPDASASTVTVINTLSWNRSELVTVPSADSSAGDRVTDQRGRAVPSQRLTSGELVFLAEAVPALAGKAYQINSGTPSVPKDAVKYQDNVLENGLVRVRIDPKTGGISELSRKGMDGNLVDTTSGESLNDYKYLIGDDISQVKGVQNVKISVGERGPLVASLIIESTAPGCRSLRCEVRMVAGQDYVEIINLLDKARLDAPSYMDKSGKESVNFAFPFAIPSGELLVDLPLAAMRPEADQMPSACKNWVTVGRWVEVSNAEKGVTWVTLDAPLIEIGTLSANLLNSQTNPEVWRKKIEPTSRFYSWAMNNHWGTNYRAYQEGLTRFRFILRPRAGTHAPAEATRFATGFTQPLLVSRETPKAWPAKPAFRLSSTDVVVTGLKPADDGNAWIIRLFGTSEKAQSVQLRWGDKRPTALYLSDTSERRGPKAGRSITVPGYGVTTVRAEFK